MPLHAFLISAGHWRSPSIVSAMGFAMKRLASCLAFAFIESIFVLVSVALFLFLLTDDPEGFVCGAVCVLADDACSLGSDALTFRSSAAGNCKASPGIVAPFACAGMSFLSSQAKSL